MKKSKLLLINILVYGVGGVVGRIIPIIMIPVITRIYPDTSFFGLNDISNTITSFAISLAGVGMYDAMFRLFFDDDSEWFKRRVCSTSLVFTIITAVIVGVALVLLGDFFATTLFGGSQYDYLVYICAFSTLFGTTNNIVAAPTRMLNRSKTFIFINSLSAFLAYGLAFVFLYLRLYTIAIPIGSMTAYFITEIIYVLLNRKWFNVKDFDGSILKSLLKIAVPIAPTFLVYWVFSSSDRIVLSQMMTMSDVGVYSVGAKLGSVSQLICAAFAGGWQFFSFSTMNEDDQVVNNSRIFEYLGIISLVSGALICSNCFWIYGILFPVSYQGGRIIAPYLFLAPLLQMLFQVGSTQYIIKKKSWPNIIILSIGAITNVLLNVVLVPFLGVEGAALGTLIGYCLSVLILVVCLMREGLFVISNRFVLVCVLDILYFFIWRLLFEGSFYGNIITMFFILVCLLLYKEEVVIVIKMLKTVKI